MSAPTDDTSQVLVSQEQPTDKFRELPSINVLSEDTTIINQTATTSTLTTTQPIFNSSHIITFSMQSSLMPLVVQVSYSF